MKLVSVAAGMLVAGLMANARADTLLSEGFGDIGTLASSGWVLTNASSPVGLPWFQGNDGVFTAQSGAATSYAAASFNSTASATGVVDNWLISPELLVGAGSTLSFSTQASDAGFLDLLEVRFSSGSGSALAGFTTLVGAVGSSVSASYPVGSWVAYTFTLPTAVSGRFAFRYTAANALDASYIGVDTVSVNSATIAAIPEPSTVALLGLGLAAVGYAQRRRERSHSTAA